MATSNQDYYDQTYHSQRGTNQANSEYARDTAYGDEGIPNSFYGTNSAGERRKSGYLTREQADAARGNYGVPSAQYAKAAGNADETYGFAKDAAINGNLDAQTEREQIGAAVGMALRAGQATAAQSYNAGGVLGVGSPFAASALQMAGAQAANEAGAKARYTIISDEGKARENARNQMNTSVGIQADIGRGQTGIADSLAEIDKGAETFSERESRLFQQQRERDGYAAYRQRQADEAAKKQAALNRKYVMVG